MNQILSLTKKAIMMSIIDSNVPFLPCVPDSIIRLPRAGLQYTIYICMNDICSVSLSLTFNKLFKADAHLCD